MFARGNGTFSYDEHSIYFLRLVTSKPIVIELKLIKEIKTGKWHAGQWGAGKPIIKILWKKDKQLLSSGFSFPAETVEGVLSELNDKLKQNI